MHGMEQNKILFLYLCISRSVQEKTPIQALARTPLFQYCLNEGVNSVANPKKPFVLYFLVSFLILGWTFIGWNFAGKIGAAICAFFALAVFVYAFQIEEEE